MAPGWVLLKGPRRSNTNRHKRARTIFDRDRCSSARRPWGWEVLVAVLVAVAGGVDWARGALGQVCLVHNEQDWEGWPERSLHMESGPEVAGEWCSLTAGAGGRMHLLGLGGVVLGVSGEAVSASDGISTAESVVACVFELAGVYPMRRAQHRSPGVAGACI